ncbi:MAG: hypothetical protein AVDCRST_MAG73-3028, partial [uncultured Thermomicrobiales bacterium]
ARRRRQRSRRPDRDQHRAVPAGRLSGDRLRHRRRRRAGGPAGQPAVRRRRRGIGDDRSRGRGIAAGTGSEADRDRLRPPRRRGVHLRRHRGALGRRRAPRHLRVADQRRQGQQRPQRHPGATRRHPRRRAARRLQDFGRPGRGLRRLLRRDAGGRSRHPARGGAGDPPPEAGRGGLRRSDDPLGRPGLPQPPRSPRRRRGDPGRDLPRRPRPDDLPRTPGRGFGAAQGGRGLPFRGQRAGRLDRHHALPRQEVGRPPRPRQPARRLGPGRDGPPVGQGNRRPQPQPARGRRGVRGSVQVLQAGL